MRIRDWSSDVCSSDLTSSESTNSTSSSRSAKADEITSTSVALATAGAREVAGMEWRGTRSSDADRKRVVEGKSVSGRVDLGGRRIMTKKTTQITNTQQNCASSTNKIKLQCTQR